MAGNRDQGLFCLFRSPHQHPLALGLSRPHQRTVVPQSAATQPAASADLEANGSPYRPVSAARARAAPVAGSKVPRHALEVGAECLNWARSDLCGGWPAMAIPTAIKK